jgi:putative transposase
MIVYWNKSCFNLLEVDTKIQTKENISTKKKKKIDEYIFDGTIVKVSPDYIWIWVAIEPENKEILRLIYTTKNEMCFL